MKNKIRKEWEKLRKKYKLPSYKELDVIFEISKIEKREFLLRAVRRYMLDKIINLGNYFEGIITSQRLLSFYMVKKFSELDKIEINKLIEKIANLTLKYVILEIEKYNEKAEAEAIKELYREWLKLGEKIKKLVEKVLKHIEAETKQKKYFG